jgi:hypothetical protein
MTDQEQPVAVEYFNGFGTLLTSDARCTRDGTSRIPMAKAALNEKKIILFSLANWP